MHGGLDGHGEVWWKNKELKHDNLLPFLKSLRRSLWDVSLVPLLPLARSLGWPLAARPSSP